MKKSKKILLLIFIVVFFLFGAGKIIIGNMVRNCRNVQNISVSMPSLSNVPDGNYIGEYTIAPIYVKAEVSVTNHRITNITILQRDNRLGSTAESIVNDVVQKQFLRYRRSIGSYNKQ